MIQPYLPLPLVLIQQPFDHPDYLFEVKYDGWRCLAFSDPAGVRLVSRNGNAFKRFAAGPGSGSFGCLSSLLFGVLGGALEFAGERTSIGRRQHQSGSNVQASRGWPDQLAGIEAAQDLGAALLVAAAFDEGAVTFGDQLREGEDGLGGEHDPG